MINLKKCEEEQSKLASKVVLCDSFDGIETIAGAEAYIVDKRIVACAVVCDASTLAVKDKAIAFGFTDLKFHPEFRSYREGPLLGEALSSLSIKPDMVMFNGDGVLHPRHFGLACHLGVLLDVPTVGILKESLFGEVKNEDVIYNGETLGKLVKTKDHANPIVVSAGHKITLSKAVSLVFGCIREPHKMPEPLHLAHKLAKKRMGEKD